MLFIFHVDTGTMMTFDINLALENVGQLKEAIQRTCGIAVDKQVLLVSGGECLEPNVRVCSYSAGTDTNPIFLFSKSSIESTTPPCPSIDYGVDPDLKDEVDQSLNLAPSKQTVAVRSQLAQQFCELARYQAKVCEKLVHDQHMQQQGWAAVIANLDDITVAFKARSENFEQSFKQHLETRDQYMNILDSFNNDVGTLSKIPVLPALMEKDELEASSSSTTSASGPQTLLQWISSKDSQSSLDQVSEQCKKGLDQFDEKILEGLKAEVRSALDAAQTSELREIKGLGDRLYGLEQLRVETKKIVQEQTDLAQAFLLNQARAANIGDTSILPDLCNSHKRQLVVMLRNHHQLRDIRRRCIKAKQELSTNLYHRLKWVMFVESRISELDMKLVMYHENIKRLRRQLEVLSQIHLAPNVYLTAVAEVVRRRAFSQAFLVWANDLACQLCAVHSEEVARRKNFQNQFEGHFLSSLFPGLEDSPPPFATQAPPLFDSELPKLSIDDVDRLRSELPDLALSLSIPDLNTITQFFLNRSITNLKTEGSNGPVPSIEDRIVQAVSAAGLSSNLDPALLQPAENSLSLAQSANTTHPISSDRGFESETDTEEFEKVGQSPGELNKVQNDLRSNLKAQLQNINGAVEQALNELRSNMGQLKQWVLCERSELDSLVQRVISASKDHNDKLLQALKDKEIELENVISQKYELEQRLKHALDSEERERLLREEAEKRLEAERVAGKAVVEQLKVNHHIELEALRGRYRLYYNQGIEKSFNDIEEEDKMEREIMERGQHESIVSQLKEKMLAEHEKALNEQRSYWQRELAQAKIRVDSDKQVIFNEAVRQVAAEKDRLLDSMRVREISLVAECAKQQETITRLSDINLSNNENPATDNLASRLREVEVENTRLRMELNSCKGFPPRSTSPSTSIVTLDTMSSCSSKDAATSPECSPRRNRRLKKTFSESINNLIEQGKIHTGTCAEGEAVLVFWNDTRQAYDILQNSSKPHFLDTDSIKPLGLECTDPRISYSIGQVVHKDYCQAKKIFGLIRNPTLNR
ncbi:RB1-inducible coiled-coil protein 1 isoform X2 [Cimex lectularius]|uniref:RB1-inducible coiled-coil protein 1 n=1 Tax=Cimex lectularius TaxID=79782 RepID=A0A8I6SAQ1_CIMLE|nr:RB1-inducible coiled-coil protein 1 isoform X2 [Cimex lectularius]